MSNLLSFPLAHQSQKITKAEYTDFVRLIRDVQEAESILAEMKADLEARRESIIRRLEQGGEIEDSGRIACGG